MKSEDKDKTSKEVHWRANWSKSKKIFCEW